MQAVDVLVRYRMSLWLVMTGAPAGVLWFGPDREWVGVCEEFGPQVGWLDADRQAAERGIRVIVGEAIGMLQGRGDPIPDPRGP